MQFEADFWYFQAMFPGKNCKFSKRKKIYTYKTYKSVRKSKMFLKQMWNITLAFQSVACHLRIFDYPLTHQVEIIGHMFLRHSIFLLCSIPHLKVCTLKFKLSNINIRQVNNRNKSIFFFKYPSGKLAFSVLILNDKELNSKKVKVKISRSSC